MILKNYVGSFAVTSASNPDHQELAKMEAPTTSKSNGVKKPDSSKVIMDYSTDFPKLPEALPAPLPSKVLPVFFNEYA